MRLAVHFNFAIEINGKTPLSRASWRRLARKVKKRDAGTCFYCGILAPDGHADHVIPLSRGGTDDLENLVWACPKCNLAKGDMTLQEWREQQEKERQEQERTETETRERAQDMVSEERRKQISEMHAAGHSQRAIEREVFGFEGGSAHRAVRDVLDGATAATAGTGPGKISPNGRGASISSEDD